MKKILRKAQKKRLDIKLLQQKMNQSLCSSPQGFRKCKCWRIKWWWNGVVIGLFLICCNWTRIEEVYIKKVTCFMLGQDVGEGGQRGSPTKNQKFPAPKFPGDRRGRWIEDSCCIYGRESPFSHSRSFLISKTCNTAISPYFPLKITYFPLFFTLFPQKILDMQGKGTLFRPHKSKFRSYISQIKDDTKFLLKYICVLRCRLHTSRFRAWYCRRTTPWMDEYALIIFLKRQAIR